MRRQLSGLMACLVWGSFAVTTAGESDEPKVVSTEKKAAPPAWKGWQVGEIFEVEVRYSLRIAQVEDSSNVDQSQYHFVYLDRVDRIEKGRVTQVTRHFKRARKLGSGKENRPSELEGRALRVTEVERVPQAEWDNGRELSGELSEQFFASGWPVSPEELGAKQGDRGGKFGKLLQEERDELAEKGFRTLPDQLKTELLYFPYDVMKGKWQVRLSGTHTPYGTGALSMQLTGCLSSDFEEEAVVESYKQKVDISIALRPAKEKALPTPLPPPAAKLKKSVPDSGKLDETEEEEEEPEGEEEE